MKNSVKEMIKNGKQAVGTFLQLGNENAAECLGIAGADYFIVDTEHSPYGMREIAECCRCGELKGIGPYDLSVSLQKPGQFQDHNVMEAFVRIQKICRQFKKPVFIFAPDLKTAKLRLNQGYDSVCFSTDLNVLADAYIAAMKALRMEMAGYN
ncbi:MAG: hypothetical protein ACI4F3_03750 [Enterocloster sp.]